MDDPRGDRKILVTVRLARPEVAGAAHCTTSSLALRAGRAERPHIGEYAGKTNAFAGCTAMQPAHFTGPAARFPPVVLA
jgi:hypothetical protein